MEQNYYKYKVENIISIDSIITMHNFNFDKHFSSKEESHDFYEFIFVKKGSLIVYQGDEKVELEQNEIIFHKPNVPHRISSNRNSNPSILIVSFSSKSQEMHFFDNRKFHLTNDLIQILNIVFDLGAKTFDIDSTTPDTKKMSLKENAIMGGIQSIKNMVEFFLIEIIKKEKSSNEKIGLFLSGDNLIDNIICYLKNNIYSNITIATLSKYFGYSKSFIFKEFKKKTNTTIINYFNELKIEEAKSLLRKGEHNITEISTLLAFDNPNYFSKVFKKFVGISPLKYQSKYNIL